MNDEPAIPDGYERHYISFGGRDYVSDLPIGYELVQREMWRKASAAATLLADLDRCEHGRHEGDVCSGLSGCNGASHGNPFAPPGTRIGTNISGWAIVVPDSKDGASNRSRSIGDSSLWTVAP